MVIKSRCLVPGLHTIDIRLESVKHLNFLELVLKLKLSVFIVLVNRG